MVSTIVYWVGIITCVWLLIRLVSRLVSYLREMPRLSLQNRWVVVTGCDSGIGQGVMHKLIEDDTSVIAFCFTPTGAEAALKAGAKHAFQLDLTDETAVADTSTKVQEICEGKLWGIVHNAGFVQAGFAEYQPLANYHKTMDINFFAIVNLTQKLIPSIKKTAGRVVLVSSVDGIVSLPGNAPYDASKFAVEAYADALRVELSFWDIDVSVINPSTLRTPLAMSFFDSHVKTWEQMQDIDPDGAWQEGWSRDWLDRYHEANRNSLDQIAQDPEHAINDIVHAVSAKRPKFRYLSGTAAKTLFYALWKMPEHWSFAIKKGLVNPKPDGTQ